MLRAILPWKRNIVHGLKGYLHMDIKKILFVFLIIGSFVIARRYSGADDCLKRDY